MWSQECALSSSPQGLSQLIDDATNQRKPQPAFQSVHEAAKGVLFDLDDDSMNR
jgi:hypothetical protein